MKSNENFRRLKNARAFGEQVAIEFGFTDLPVDPFAIAVKKDILVQAKPDTAEGVSGMLLRHGNEFGIMYATHIPSEGFQRFCVAHELGHFHLEGHPEHIFPSGEGLHCSCAGFSSGDIFELEADYFAAGLLLPGILFERAVSKAQDGLDGIVSVAKLAKTSLTATAIRYAEYTACPAAIILSASSSIDYCFMSESLRELRDITWLKKGSSLPNSSETVGFNRNAKNIQLTHRVESETELSDWFGGSLSHTGLEQAIGLGGYGKTLTVLTFPELPDQEEMEEEEALAESLTPRFRR